MILFCIPHAGGSSLQYLKWEKYLDKNILFYPIDFSGHGKRVRENVPDNFNMVLEDVYNFILSKIRFNTDKYCIFGHSLGCTIAYELYRKLVENNIRLPDIIFFSGRWPPYINKNNFDYDLNDYNAFLHSIDEMGGMDILSESNEQVKSYFLSLVYSDFKVLDTYRHLGEKCGIKSDMVIMNGKKDDGILYREISAWNDTAESNITFKQIEGTHFFPTDNARETVSYINAVCLKDK